MQRRRHKVHTNHKSWEEEIQATVVRDGAGTQFKATSWESCSPAAPKILGLDTVPLGRHKNRY
jgi:hypothetical protein